MNEELNERILDLQGVVSRKLFGMNGYACGRKAFGGWWEDKIVLKLPPADHARAMDLPGAVAFDPMGGRPMKEWVVLPDMESDEVLKLAEAAKNYVQAAAG